MMSKRFGIITLSAVLGGLVVGLLCPAAHGHGNNPPRPGGPGLAPRPTVNGPYTHVTAPPQNDSHGEAMTQQGSMWGPEGGAFEAPGFGLDMVILGGAAPIDPGADQQAGIRPGDILPSGHFGPGQVPSVLRPVSSGGAIPTPGTLALLGLAALTVKRRRRK
jgi:MYXO-CTERM domain-containing protein